MSDERENIKIDDSVIEDDFLNNPRQSTEDDELPEYPDLEEVVDVEKLKKELEAINDKYTRICADYTNFRKRHSSEMLEIESYTAVSILKHFIPLLDSFNAMSFENATKDNLQEGLLALKNQLSDILKKIDVSEIQTDEGFSTKYHEAVSSVVNEEKETGDITKVYMKGYKYKDKVLRPSMVEVVSND